MKLSERSKRKLEEFFREYFDDPQINLPTIHVHCGKFAGIVTRVLKIHGITIGKHILVFPGVVYPNSESNSAISENLLSHEITHVLQYQRQGFFGFLLKYFAGYLRNLRTKKKWDFQTRMTAYYEIPHEIEARECADAYEKWSARTNLP